MDRRRHVRHEVPLPVNLGGREGKMFDMSIGGACFEAPFVDVEVGKPIEFLVTFGGNATERFQVLCRGIVIRVDSRSGYPRIATSIDSFDISNSDFGTEETEH